MITKTKKQKINNHPYKWFSLIGLSLLAFTAFLDYTIVSTAIPFIQASFKVSIVKLQWVTTIFLMIMSMSMITAGKIGDMWDRRLLFYIGFIIFAIAAIGAALSPNLTSLIIFRGIQGFSAAIIFTQSAVLLPQAFPKDEQRLAIGIYSTFTGLGLAIGPFLGGILIHYLSWRYVFWVNIPIIIVGFACCIFTLQKPPKGVAPPKFDFIGLILLIITIWGIIVGTIKWGEWIYITIGIIALILLIIQEISHPHPLIEVETFTNPYSLTGVLVCLSAAIYAMVYLFFDPIYFKVILNYNPALIGTVLVAMPISQVLVSILFPWLMKKIGLMKIIIGCSILGIIGAIFNSFFGITSPIWFIVITLFLMGFVWGAANTASITIASEHVTPEKSGTIIGTIFTSWNVSGAIFLAICSVVFNNQQIKHLNNHIEQKNQNISEVNLQELKKAIHDPDHAVQILHQTHTSINKPISLLSSHGNKLKHKNEHKNEQELYKIFSDGFLYALHYGSTVMVILLIIMFIGMIFTWVNISIKIKNN
jgi:EmrB/QacA subfamily drug resistance transporter